MLAKNLMAVILHIETSTTVCSTALSADGVVVWQRVEAEAQSHARLLPLFVQEAVEELRKRDLTVDAVAVSAGPGSYTGLRIGVSTAKGLCYGWGVPLIAVDTLKVMANAFCKKNPDVTDVLLCPMIDARRMEVYAAIYDSSLNVCRATSADIVDEESYSEFLTTHRVCFFGNGADKCRAVLTSENAEFFPDIYPTAEAMVSLADEAFGKGDFKDIAYFEPFYLKQFVATVPKQKI